jgi:hypothetical protein
MNMHMQHMHMHHLHPSWRLEQERVGATGVPLRGASQRRGLAPVAPAAVRWMARRPRQPVPRQAEVLQLHRRARHVQLAEIIRLLCKAGLEG